MNKDSNNMKRVVQISIDIMVDDTVNGDSLAEEIAVVLENRQFDVLGACFSADLTEEYRECGYDL